jgi:hypothetical protein
MLAVKTYKQMMTKPLYKEQSPHNQNDKSLILV